MLLSPRRIRLLLISTGLPVFAILCLAQEPAPIPVDTNSSSLPVLVVRVEGPDGAAFPAAADVALAGANSPAVYASTDHGEVQFSQLAAGNYSVVVTAAGYKPAQDEVTVEATGVHLQAFVRLEAIASQPLVASSVVTKAVPEKLQKDVSKGLEALQAGKWDDAQSQFEILYKRDPGEPGLNYLLGYTFLLKSRVQTEGIQSADFHNAERYLLRAATIDPKNGAAFAALGELRIQQEDYADAAPMLERAVSLDAANWSAHWSLATAYLKQQRYADARTEATAAMKAGEGAANAAEFLVGQAQAGLGQTDDAIKSLQSFLRNAPRDPSAPAAQALLARLTVDQQEEENVSEIRAAQGTRLEKSAMIAYRDSNSSPSAVANSAADVAADIALPVWAPPGVDEIHPAVASDVTCALLQVLPRVGSNIQSLVTNIDNIDASEETTHQQLNEFGDAIETTKRHHDYVANFEEMRHGDLTMTEFRNGSPAPDVFEGGVAASGLTSMALVFHPYLRDDFQMTCEGLGDWHGHPTWILYFRQREGKPGRISGYRINGTLYRLALKGRAWIASDTYQIVHIEADLVTPMPQIQLTLQHLAVDYSPVHFRAGRSVWLPSTADMYFEFRGQRLHERDSYSRYKLFSTAASEQIANPPILAPDLNAPENK